MARKYFGTDGVRGRVGEAPMTPEFAMRLGWAAGKVLAKKIIPQLEAVEEPLLKHDSSTNTLIRRYRDLKRGPAQIKKSD